MTADLHAPFARLRPRADPAALRADLRALTEGPWVDHVNAADYQGRWDVLPLRCQRRHAGAHPILQGFALETDDPDEPWVDLPPLARCPAIGALLAAIPGPLHGARLMRLRAGAHVLPHRDPGLGAAYGAARLHAPIETSDAVRFVVDGRLARMAAGELWYLNADLVHEVENRGDADRVHLVIDRPADRWLIDQLPPAPP